MNLKTLLVEEHRAALASVKKCVAMFPNTKLVTKVHEGSQAVQPAQEIQPDLAAIDIMMPGMRGLGVAKTMQVWPTPTRFLFLSMHDNQFCCAPAIALGVLPLVDKAIFVVDLRPIASDLAAATTKGAQ